MITSHTTNVVTHLFKPGVSEAEIDRLIVAASAFFDLHRNRYYGTGAEFNKHNEFHEALQAITGKKVL